MRTFLSLCAALFWALASALPAQGAEPGALTITVYGDSLGDGVWEGLYLLLRADKQVRVQRHSQLGAGLTRPDFDAWLKSLKSELEKTPPDVAVFMVGANDQQGIRDENRIGYVFASEGWQQVYGARVDAVMAEFHERHIPTVWLGLPVMRKTEYNSGARVLDSIFEAAAERNHVTFLPLASAFTDAAGNFVVYMHDGEHRYHQVRAEDGIHFTTYGYQLIAEKVWPKIQQQREAARASAAAP
jgi:hypothetical protein